MKCKLLFFLLLFQFQIKANMAEPVDRGTMFARPFTNQFVDILHEDLNIVIDAYFQSAKFEVEYHIHASKDGVNIPLLFYAYDFLDDFKIEIDGQAVELKDVPDDFENPESTKFRDFAYFFSPQDFQKNRSHILIEDAPDGGFYVDLNDLKFFETDILKGEHKIKVNYTATQWKDGWGWVNEYSFRYALSPAKYWKSFGSLSINIDASLFSKKISTNLGEPTSGSLDAIAKWNFNEMPTEVLKITHLPEISQTAAALIQIRPDRLAYILGLVLVVFHFFSIRVYRIRNPLKRFSPVVIIGSIIVPLIFFISWSYFYTLIDNVIGEHASGTHGYSELVFIFYPIVMPLYWLVMWVVDRLLKRFGHPRSELAD